MKSPLRVTTPKGGQFRLEMIPSTIYNDDEKSWALSRLAIIACLILQTQTDQPGHMPLVVSPRLTDPSPHILFTSTPRHVSQARGMVQHVVSFAANQAEGDQS